MTEPKKTLEVNENGKILRSRKMTKEDERDYLSTLDYWEKQEYLKDKKAKQNLTDE